MAPYCTSSSRHRNSAPSTLTSPAVRACSTRGSKSVGSSDFSAPWQPLSTSLREDASSQRSRWSFTSSETSLSTPKSRRIKMTSSAKGFNAAEGLHPTHTSSSWPRKTLTSPGDVCALSSSFDISGLIVGSSPDGPVTKFLDDLARIACPSVEPSSSLGNIKQAAAASTPTCSAPASASHYTIVDASIRIPLQGDSAETIQRPQNIPNVCKQLSPRDQISHVLGMTTAEQPPPNPQSTKQRGHNTPSLFSWLCFTKPAVRTVASQHQPEPVKPSSAVRSGSISGDAQPELETCHVQPNNTAPSPNCTPEISTSQPAESMHTSLEVKQLLQKLVQEVRISLPAS